MRHQSLSFALWIPATAQVAPKLNLVVIEGEGGACYATHSGSATPTATTPPGTTIAAGAGSDGPPR